MNYLAHLFLAGENEKFLIGNFIADHVKGSTIDSFHTEIQMGIRMHRSIDRYTDSHPIVQQSIVRLRPKYHKYAGCNR
jgi:acyl carrier protein phosphodiesterase